MSFETIQADPARWLGGLRSGEPAAVETLYCAIRTGAIHQALRNRLADGAADLEHEVFLSALEQLRRLREPAAFGAYLWAIVRRCTYSHLARERRWKPCRQIHYPVTWQRHPALEAHDRVIAEQEVFTAVRTMRPVQAELILRYLNGQTEGEIRRAMGYSGHEFDLLKSRAKAQVLLRLESIRAAKRRRAELLRQFDHEH